MASGVIIPVVRAGGAAARWVLKYFDDAKNVTKTSTHSSLGDAKKAAAKGGVGNPKVLKQGLRKEKTMSKKVVGRQSGSQVGSVPPPKPKPKKKKSSAIDKYLTSPRRLIGPSEMMGRPPIKESLPRKEPKIIMSGPGKPITKQEMRDFLSSSGVGDATIVGLSDADLSKAYNSIKKRVEGRRGGGKVLYKRYGGMSEVGLHPAEEARAGTMPQMARRRYMKKGGNVYRKLGGKVTDGNDVIKMIYD